MQTLGKRTRDYTTLLSIKRKAHDVIPTTFNELDKLLPLLNDEWASILSRARCLWDGNIYSFAKKLRQLVPKDATFKTEPYIQYPGDFYLEHKQTIEKWNEFSKDLMKILSVNHNPQINIWP